MKILFAKQKKMNEKYFIVITGRSKIEGKTFFYKKIEKPTAYFLFVSPRQKKKSCNLM